jgi:pyruvate dehydrogenase E2 component (dihydrolipoamide acetyltransferase)
MSTFTTITVPDTGDFKHIPVIEILVKAGDRVSRDSPLIVLESDKATLDVPSPQEGTIRELKIAVGDRVSVGTVILTLEDVAKESPASAQAPTTLTPPTIPSTSAFTSVSTPPAQAPTPVNAGDALAFPRSALRIVQEAAPPADPRRSPHASPSIRRIAREFGVDLGGVQGSGPRGRIMRQDVQSFVKTTLVTASANSAVDGAGAAGPGGFKLAPWPQVDFSKFGPIERVPQSKIRKISATNLARNSVVIPHVTNFEDADITDLDAFRRRLNAENRPTDPKRRCKSAHAKSRGATAGRYCTGCGRHPAAQVDGLGPMTKSSLPPASICA